MFLNILHVAYKQSLLTIFDNFDPSFGLQLTNKNFPRKSAWQSYRYITSAKKSEKLNAWFLRSAVTNERTNGHTCLKTILPFTSVRDQYSINMRINHFWVFLVHKPPLFAFSHAWLKIHDFSSSSIVHMKNRQFSAILKSQKTATLKCPIHGLFAIKSPVAKKEIRTDRYIYQYWSLLLKLFNRPLNKAGHHLKMSPMLMQKNQKKVMTQFSAKYKKVAIGFLKCFLKVNKNLQTMYRQNSVLICAWNSFFNWYIDTWIYVPLAHLFAWPMKRPNRNITEKQESVPKMGQNHTILTRRGITQPNTGAYDNHLCPSRACPYSHSTPHRS